MSAGRITSSVCRLVVSLGLLALAPAAMAAPGNVLGEQKISDTAGDFSGTLDNDDNFGSATAHVRDYDADTVDELIVGAHLDDDGGTNRGAAWVLFMDSDGTVSSHAKISSTSGSLTGPLDDEDQFGCAITSIGDLDGDTVDDIAVGAIGDDDGGTNRGALYILFMNANGTVKAEQKISDTAGGFGGVLSDNDEFGRSVAAIGDLDGDTVTDLVVGAAKDDDGGTDRGAVYILYMNSNGTVASEVKISDATAGLSGSLSDNDAFGLSVASLRDLDGDTVTDIMVGTPFDDDGGIGGFADRGALYTIFLNSNGSIKGVQKISDTAGSFNGTLDDGDMFGSAIGRIGDIDGDGVADVAVGAIGDDQGGPGRGQVWVLFMTSAGAVKAITGFRRINVGTSGFTGPLADGDFFGSALVSPRDFDGDQIPDLAVGARHDADGGSNRGAVWFLNLDGVPGALCGDDILDPGEDCDDGNNDNGDCCDEDCMFEGNGSPCGDADVCNGDETCDGAGTCQAGTPLDCDDSMACTQDTCDPILGCESTSGPAPVCFFAGKGSVSLTDKIPNSKDKVTWKWLKGEQVDLVDFGDPQNTDEYTLCIYDNIADVPSLKSELMVPASPAKWSPKGTKGWKYKDSAAVEAGVRTIILTSGLTGKSKIVFKAKGDNLGSELPGPVGVEYYDQDTSVIMQLISSGGFCWTSVYGEPSSKNEVERFKDKFP